MTHHRGLVIQRERFGIENQLLVILKNTARHLYWLEPPDA
jgi:hypothetical protein